MKIRDRIKELRRVPASELLPNPKNWRTHPESQRNALRGVLAEVGYADALLARELPDGSLMLVDGHLRAETTPGEVVPVLVLDLSEADADKLLATLDPLAAMAEADAGRLDELLRDIETGNDDLANLITSIAEQNGIVPSDGKEPELKQLDVKPPPKMTWVLVGIPTVSYGSIADKIEKIALIPDTIVESTCNDG